jgi:hypothetical protein
MEMHQTHCYATVTATLLQQRYQRLNMSQYDDFYTYSSFSLTYSHTCCNTDCIKILFCSCLGLLPNNGSNNVTITSFNCCILKLLGNSAYLQLLYHRNVCLYC